MALTATWMKFETQNWATRIQPTKISRRTIVRKSTKKHWISKKKTGPGRIRTRSLCRLTEVYYLFSRWLIEFIIYNKWNMWVNGGSRRWVMWTKLLTGKRSSTRLQYPCLTQGLKKAFSHHNNSTQLLITKEALNEISKTSFSRPK